MLVITKHPERWKHLDPKMNDVISDFFEYAGADRIAEEQHQQSFRSTYGTESGPVIVMGMGPSRLELKGRKVKYPIMAINRAILDFPEAKYWCAQDRESIQDCLPKLKELGATPALVTYACHFRTDWWKNADWLKKIFIEIFPDPRRHARRPLYWNQTTVGWTWDLAIRMGFSKIYCIGIGTSTRSYVNPHYSHEYMDAQHACVRDRLVEMFLPSQIGGWNEKGVPLVDLAFDGYLPIEKGSVNDVCE